jgi:hypothetical protein
LWIAKQDIDIRGQVELAAAELTETDDEQLLRTAICRPWRTVLVLQAPLMLVHGGLQTGLGQGGQVVECLSERRQPAQVAPDNAQHFSVAKSAQTRIQAMPPDFQRKLRGVGRLLQVETLAPLRVTVEQP